jgi:hypothetical protein
MVLLAAACGGGSGRRTGGGGGIDGGPSGCTPGTRSCEGDAVTVCRADGSGFDVVEMCDGASGLHCDRGSGACADLCAVAAEASSYVGCEYWPTPVVNLVAAEFEFAIVVSNPQSVTAQVTVTQNGTVVAEGTVPPDGIETVRLPWVDALKAPVTADVDGNATFHSAIVRGAAYRLTSTVPVVVYQFNPLEYRVDRDCVDEVGGEPGDGVCHSYTNDASLLLPTTALTENYVALARATQLRRVQARDSATGELIPDPATGAPFTQWSSTPGYVAITGADTSPVDVTVTFAAHVSASQDGSVSRQSAGSTATYRLDPGDVLQLVSDRPPLTCSSSVPADEIPTDCGVPCDAIYTYCDVGREYDLTGTTISASGKVSVISGHVCAFVPDHRWACDHLEEAMFPLESWGKDFVVSITQPLRSEPNLIQIVSGDDGNALTFDPASVHAPATLGRGDVLVLEAREDFRVTGSGALLVGQLLVGQDYDGYGSSEPMSNGDPALSLAVPSEQFRTSYTFLAPTTYAVSYVNVTAPDGAQVLLDGAPVTGFRPVGGTGQSTARVMIDGGAHRMSSDRPFGIVVYGFGSYTSYMYPGGLNFERINLI